MTKYGRFKMSHKLRGFLGETENKMDAATAGGTNHGVGEKLTQLLPQSTAGWCWCSGVPIMQPAAGSYIVPDEAQPPPMWPPKSGHQRWSTVLNTALCWRSHSTVYLLYLILLPISQLMYPVEFFLPSGLRSPVLVRVRTGVITLMSSIRVDEFVWLLVISLATGSLPYARWHWCHLEGTISWPKKWPETAKVG